MTHKLWLFRAGGCVMAGTRDPEMLKKMIQSALDDEIEIDTIDCIKYQDVQEWFDGEMR